jgi:hypothetical protein
MFPDRSLSPCRPDALIVDGGLRAKLRREKIAGLAISRQQQLRSQ